MDGKTDGAGQGAVQHVTKQATSLAKKRWKLCLADYLYPLMFRCLAQVCTQRNMFLLV
jgi:hypothetical protein